MKKEILKININTKKSFTLAEILTVITILGTVAAMTISTIYKDFERTKIETGIKTSFSILSNALDMANAEIGSIESINFERFGLNDTDGKNGFNRSKAFAEKYLIPYLNVAKICKTQDERCFTKETKKDGKNGYNYDYWFSSKGNNVTAWSYGPTYAYRFQLKNGMSVAVESIYLADNANLRHLSGSWVKITVDIDGPNKGKTIMGRDVFVYSYGLWHNGQRQGLLPGLPLSWNNKGTEPYFYSNLTYYGKKPTAGLNCFKENGSDNYGEGMCGTTQGCNCAIPIVKNNFKVPKDYPLNKIARKRNPER